MPPMAAMTAWRSESLPSVAETSVRSTVSNFSGSAPVCSTSARSSASCCEESPVIWALSPAIPSGFWMKSMVGNDRISPSRTIAKCWRMGSGLASSSVLDLAAAAANARDLVELVAALVGELQRHDRLAGLAEVGGVPRSRDRRRPSPGRIHGVVRPVLEEVVERPSRRADAAGTDIGRRAARDDDAVPRYSEDLPRPPEARRPGAGAAALPVGSGPAMRVSVSSYAYQAVAARSPRPGPDP